MTAQRFLKAILVALTLMLGVPATAQTTVSNNDIQRLQDEIYEANRDMSRMRSTDSATASSFSGVRSNERSCGTLKARAT